MRHRGPQQIIKGWQAERLSQLVDGYWLASCLARSWTVHWLARWFSVWLIVALDGQLAVLFQGGSSRHANHSLSKVRMHMFTVVTEKHHNT